MIALRAGAAVLAVMAASASEQPRKYTYWAEACTSPQSGCQADDPQLAAWALEAWQKASAGGLEFSKAKDEAHARIRVVWATSEQGMYGETRRITVDGQSGAEVFVRPSPLPASGDRLLRDTIVYLTCLHETGHALGLPHTAAFEDIMYSFQYGGDIPEYFGRYRRKLKVREDIRLNSGISPQDMRHLLFILTN